MWIILWIKGWGTIKNPVQLWFLHHQFWLLHCLLQQHQSLCLLTRFLIHLYQIHRTYQEIHPFVLLFHFQLFEWSGRVLKDLTIFMMPSISLYDINHTVVPEPEAPDPKLFYEFLRLLLILLLLILMVSSQFWPRSNKKSTWLYSFRWLSFW